MNLEHAIWIHMMAWARDRAKQEFNKVTQEIIHVQPMSGMSGPPGIGMKISFGFGLGKNEQL